jgi:tRNA-specific 2-thiouridylase
VPYDAFVEHHLGQRPGPIVEDTSGRVLGEHRGHWFHTIGQRRGLGLAGGPWYVVAKHTRRNEIRVIHGEFLANCRRRRLRIVEPSWIAEPAAPGRLEVRIRHGERSLPCVVETPPDGSLEITLEDDGDPGIAAGQFAVLYDGDECLGGGPIGG